jgi:hypothetical protein
MTIKDRFNPDNVRPTATQAMRINAIAMLSEYVLNWILLELGDLSRAPKHCGRPRLKIETIAIARAPSIRLVKMDVVVGHTGNGHGMPNRIYRKLVRHHHGAAP